MRRAVLLLGALALALAACGENSGTGTAPSSTDTATTEPDSTSKTSTDSSVSTGEPPTTTPMAGRPVVLTPSPDADRAEPVEDAPIAELIAGLNDAGFRLWRDQPSADNLVFSPASVGHALLMARAAADTTTGSVIDQAFGLPEGNAAHEAWNAVDHAITAAADREAEITVTIADRMWPRLDVRPDQDWIDLLARQHGATTEALDFAADPSGSRAIINDWVSDQTDGLIPELLPEGFIDPATVLVLTDAIYFKAQWQRVFGKYSNVTDAFTLLDGSTVEVEYLRELELADRRGTGDGFVGAELPYVGGEFSMLVIVPEGGRFAEVRHRLDQALLDEIDRTFTTGPYELLIPPWTTNTHLDLLPWLRDIGAAPGGYPGISPDAFLDGAVHGADITVDEWGTVAAAATGLGFRESGPPEPELTIAADRPFLYLIRHRTSGLVLFAGQVTDPAG